MMMLMMMILVFGVFRPAVDPLSGGAGPPKFN